MRLSEWCYSFEWGHFCAYGTAVSPLKEQQCLLRRGHFNYTLFGGVPGPPSVESEEVTGWNETARLKMTAVEMFLWDHTFQWASLAFALSLFLRCHSSNWRVSFSLWVIAFYFSLPQASFDFISAKTCWSILDICLPYFLKGVFFTIQWKVNFQKVWKLTFHQLVKNIQIENPLTDR